MVEKAELPFPRTRESCPGTSPSGIESPSLGECGGDILLSLESTGHPDDVDEDDDVSDDCDCNRGGEDGAL